MGKRLKDEDLVLNIIVNGDKGKKEMLKLQRNVRDMNLELGRLRKTEKQMRLEGKQSTQEYKNLRAAIKQKTQAVELANSRIIELRKGMDLTRMSVVDLRKEMARLSKLRNITTPNTKAWHAFDQQLKKVKNRYGEVQGAQQATASSFKKMLGNMVRIIGVYAGVTAVIRGIGNLVRGAGELSDSISDVQKTTELTNAEMEQLMKRFKTFNTRTPRKELLALADEAGKMGKRGVAAVALYVEETNELTTALKDLGEDAGLAVAKMADRFDVSMRQIGSGINAVADGTKAKASFITEFLARLGGTAKAVGIGAGDILGYGAALDEAGQKVEKSSTALNTFLIDFTKNTEFYGKAAGFAKGELDALVGKEGTNEGFVSFLERLKEMNPESDDFLRKLEEIGINGDRGAQVFLALSQNVEQLRERQALANREIEKGTSLTEEYNKKNNNLAGSMAKIGNSIKESFISSDFKNWLDGVVGKMADWVELPLSETLTTEAIKLGAVRLELTDVNTTVKRRLGLIEDLKKAYPDLLKNIDAETTTNGELLLILDQINESLIDRIVIQKKTEEVEAAAEKAADTKLGKLEKEIELRQHLSKIAKELKITVPEGLGLTGQAEFLRDKAKPSGEGPWTLSQKNDAAKVTTLLRQIRKATSRLKEEEQAYLLVLASKNQLLADQKKNNLQANNDSPGNPNPKPKPDPYPPKTPKPLTTEEIAKRYNDTLNALKIGENAITEELRAQLIKREIHQKAFDQKMAEYRLSSLVGQKAAMQLAGMDTIDIEKQINDAIFSMQLVARDEKITNANWEKVFNDQLLDQLQEGIDTEIDLQIKRDEVEEQLFEKKQKRWNKNRKNTQEEIDLRQSAMKAAILTAARTGAAAIESAKTAQEAGAAIIESIRGIIKAYVAQAVTSAILDVITKNVFAGLVLSPIIAASVGKLFDALIPKFAATTQPILVRGAEDGGFQDVTRAQDGKRFRAKERGAARGYFHKPSLLVAESQPEFVANGAAVANPSVKPILDLIDVAQRNGSISTLNLMNSIVPRIPGFDNGGYPGQSNNPVSDNELKNLIAQSSKINQLLIERLKEPIEADVVLYKFKDAENLLKESKGSSF